MAKVPFRPIFDPAEHESELEGLLAALHLGLDDRELQRLLRRHPKKTGATFSKSEIIRGFRHLAPRLGLSEAELVARLRAKPVRTASGVAPVTVLTKPYPCPGKCIFCPNDVRMPKSYLSREPGAQRAAQHDFDPYGQALGRLLTYHHNGHPVDKVELIVLGGTWSFYPEEYQIYFVRRLFDALNDFCPEEAAESAAHLRGPLSFDPLDETIDGRHMARTYNQVVTAYLRRNQGGELENAAESADWPSLEEAQRRNEKAHARCVGLVIETRPDHLPDEEVLRIRRLGCTKVQIGIQSLDDQVLEKNKRGHDVEATRRAMLKLRAAGFKLHAHWMPNLLGATPESDAEDFRKLFAEEDFRPDELKVYPCSLIESAELMRHFESGDWRPYGEEELVSLLELCLLEVPEYCRVTRMIRDIPGDEILVGNKVTNLREVVERRLAARGLASRDIRAREVRRRAAAPEELTLDRQEYATSLGREIFLQFVDGERRLAGFCRLALPAAPVAIPEIARSAMIREVHVYGTLAGFGGSGTEVHTQHRGLGRRLVEAAAEIAGEAGFADLAVISAIGTRDYYRGLGFADGVLYQHRQLGGEASPLA
jgi:elongator complex protein 3